MLKIMNNKLNLIIVLLLIFIVIQIVIKFHQDYSFVRTSESNKIQIKSECEYTPKLEKLSNGEYKYHYVCTKNSYITSVLLPPIFENAYDFQNGLAVVSIKNYKGEKKYTIINKLGNPIIPSDEYDYISAYDFDGKKAIVCKGPDEYEW